MTMSNPAFTNKEFRQEIVLTAIPTITGSLSLVSSAIIVFIILRDGRRKLNKTKERILLGVSLADMVQSICCVLTRFPAPSESDIYGLAVGNTATCNFQGVLYQFGFCGPMLTATLATYYMFAVRYNKYEEAFRKAEPYIQGFIFLYGIGTSVAGIIFNSFNYSGSALGCWVTVPTGCDGEDPPDTELCQRGQGADFFVVIFGALPLLVSFMIICVTMTLIYRFVRQREKKSKKWKGYNGMEFSSTGSNDRSNRTKSLFSRRPSSSSDDENTTFLSRVVARTKSISRPSFINTDIFNRSFDLSKLESSAVDPSFELGHLGDATANATETDQSTKRELKSTTEKPAPLGKIQEASSMGQENEIFWVDDFVNESKNAEEDEKSLDLETALNIPENENLPEDSETQAYGQFMLPEEEKEEEKVIRVDIAACGIPKDPLSKERGLASTVLMNSARNTIAYSPNKEKQQETSDGQTEPQEKENEIFWVDDSVNESKNTEEDEKSLDLEIAQNIPEYEHLSKDSETQTYGQFMSPEEEKEEEKAVLVDIAACSIPKDPLSKERGLASTVLMNSARSTIAYSPNKEKQQETSDGQTEPEGKWRSSKRSSMWIALRGSIEKKKPNNHRQRERKNFQEPRETQVFVT